MRGLCAAFIAVVPGLALAAPYDGTYRQTANADCGIVGVDGAAVRISDGIFYGVGMECRMTRPVNVVDMEATLYTMVCTGEDQTWTERAMVMEAAGTDGIIMLWDGYAFAYESCRPNRGGAAPSACGLTPGIFFKDKDGQVRCSPGFGPRY